MGWRFTEASLERRRTIPIPLSAPYTDGNSGYDVLGFASWQAGHWRYTKDVDGYVFGAAQLPWNVQPQVFVVGMNIMANATSGVTRMAVWAHPVADGEQLNFGTWEAANVATDVTVPGTAYLQRKVEITVPGATWAPGDTVVVSLSHQGSHANDTLAANTLLLNAWLRIE